MAKLSDRQTASMRHTGKGGSASLALALARLLSRRLRCAAAGVCSHLLTFTGCHCLFSLVQIDRLKLVSEHSFDFTVYLFKVLPHPLSLTTGEDDIIPATLYGPVFPV